MQSSINEDAAPAAGARAPRVRARAVISAAIAASALLAITAATALPPHAQTAEVTSSLHRRLTGRAGRSPVAAVPTAEPATERFTGRVGQDLTQALRAAGVPELQGRQYVAVLGRAIPLVGGLSIDDRFDLVLQRDGGGRPPQLVYVGLDRVARADVELLKWTDGRNIVWVNADGVGGQDSSGISLPIQGRMTSGFGNRFHPILGYERFHAGVDLAAAAGTPILAAADGRVLAAGWRGGYGQEVEIAHGAGLETRYGHMSRIAARIGSVVRKGQVIGWVGSTGLSTGPHVHFEVTRNGRPVNPMSVKTNSGPGHLEGNKLHQFDTALRGLLLRSGRTG